MIDRDDEAMQGKTNIGNVEFAFGGVKLQRVKILDPVKAYMPKKAIVHGVGRILLNAELLGKMLQGIGNGVDIEDRNAAGFTIRQQSADEAIFDLNFGNRLEADVRKAVFGAAEIVAFQHHWLGVVVAYFQKNRYGRDHIRQLFFDVGAQVNLLGRADHGILKIEHL